MVINVNLVIGKFLILEDVVWAFRPLLLLVLVLERCLSSLPMELPLAFLQQPQVVVADQLLLMLVAVERSVGLAEHADGPTLSLDLFLYNIIKPTCLLNNGIISSIE